ncbi:arylsulfatase [Verrucomicrobiaceae bacterium N1E253]|uniref:Arylsulfatase n=1 Tax=Oceaniferula marina TaxID=2748318 RepID=A0A851GNG3_9BACT|nr:arylsulfatase [Oceaniferula marina]NWK56577.1 arylsulfatase [Oceaniferula marina]
MTARFALILFCLLPCLSTLAKDKPNIVFILADDMSYDSVAANNPASGPLQTPHIDKLVSQGMNFTDAHSGSAVCTPTRYGLLTGRYAWRTRLKRSVLWNWAPPLIEKERLTVAEMLQQQGYATGMVGKWHLGLDWYDKNGKIANDQLKITDASFRKGDAAKRVQETEQNIDFSQAITGGPTDNGFDSYFGVDVPNFPPYIWIANDRLQGLPTASKPKSMFGSAGPMLPGWKLEDILPTLGRKSVEWIHTQSKKDKPFFLYLSLTSPHTPIAPSKTFQGKSGVSHYADFVMETDWVVGQVLEALEQSGTADNTLVIFSCDNGTSAKANFKQLEQHGVDLHHHFKGHKAQIHEGGHRVPFIVRWPGKTQAGSHCDQTICLNDFMATTASLLDVTLPDNAAEDSTNILPLITGQQSSLPQRPLVINHDIQGKFAIRKGPWKLTGNKLFHLKNDPKETSDVAKQHPELVSELKKTLVRYQQQGHSRH